MEEPTAIREVARESLLRICHFDSSTGEETADAAKCSRACYKCLLSYANQPDHPILDRTLIRDFLLKICQASTRRIVRGKPYDEQFRWLVEHLDPNSSLESDLLKLLYGSRRRLPDRAQYRPEPGVYAEADFFYEREGLKGIAVFVDGPHHDEQSQREKDQRERKKLEDLGYRVLTIRYDCSLEEQVRSHSSVFGPRVTC
jgi:hypothetical protein